MDPALLGDLDAMPTPPPATVGRPAEDYAYATLRCRCGHERFHLSGWTRIATDGGGFFWRSLTRVFREARVLMDDGEPAESPFWLPVFLRCDACGRESALADREGLAGRLPDERRGEPREAFRCRACRRGSVEVALGVAEDAARAERVDLEVIARCHRCTRVHRLAWSRGRPSDQEVRLDLLYGRR